VRPLILMSLHPEHRVRLKIILHPLSSSLLFIQSVYDSSYIVGFFWLTFTTLLPCFGL